MFLVAESAAWSRELPIDESYTIGRARDRSLVLDDPLVSRRHVTIRAIEDIHVLIDEGSSNGSYVNGVRIAPGAQVILREGDVIEVGGYKLSYRASDLPSPARDASPHELRTWRFPRADLVKDGQALAEGAGLGRDRIAQLLIGVPHREGLER